VVTLTVSEKGYCLAGDGSLDFSHPDIAADLAAPETPRSAIGWLSLALAERRKTGAGPLTILSCDNLQSNGEKLANAVTAFSERTRPGLANWITANTAYPLTLVDCIVPASDATHRARVHEAIGELARIRQQQKTGGVEVEAADRHPPSRWQAGKHRRAARRITSGDQLAAWLVVYQDPDSRSD
jgi:hypothetical protein